MFQMENLLDRKELNQIHGFSMACREKMAYFQRCLCLCEQKI